MRDAVICEPVRTPVGRQGGMFATITATELAATVISALVERTGIPPGEIDDVLFGQCYPNGEAPAIGRVAALDAGLPVTVSGWQIDRRCGSGLQAIIYAAMHVQTGVADAVLAGGVESMSQAEFYALGLRSGVKGESLVVHDRIARGRVTAGGKDYPVPGGMVETAENLRRKYHIPREEQDELAVSSHRRAIAAQQDGRFDDEIVPVTITDRKGVPTVIAKDEHPRPDTSMETLASLPPVMFKRDPTATVTAGNASGQNDGASACVVTTARKAAELGMAPYARLVSWGVAGVPPPTMGIGPVPATAKALAHAGLTFADLDLIELNEAFAAQVLACTRDWKFAEHDFGRMNVNGSGISLGHPVGATGGRILATLLREMRRRDARYGLETMCIGGGQGLAAVFERA
jgi:acetyl-CoA C-acetyltransferase